MFEFGKKHTPLQLHPSSAGGKRDFFRGEEGGKRKREEREGREKERREGERKKKEEERDKCMFRVVRLAGDIRRYIEDDTH